MAERWGAIPRAILSKARRFCVVAFAAAALTVLLLSRNAVQASPSTFTVNSTADAVDISPGDGVCSTAAGECTLRAAIQETNALAGADTINVPSGTYTLSISGADEDAAVTGDLDIVGELTINGAAAAATIIDGGGMDRVLDVSGTLNASGVTIKNGHVAAWGGGMRNAGSVTLAHGIVSGNTSDWAGGGISNSGNLRLDNTVVSSNNDGSGGAGGIYNRGTMTLTDSTISGNTTSQGAGGIGHVGGTATLSNVTVTGNSAWVGAGIFSNTAGQMTLTNVTISGNTAGGPAGGIYNYRTVVTLTNVTITDNWAYVGGGVYDREGTVWLRNTIVANSGSGGDCWEAMEPGITSLGHNLASDGSCGLSGPGDISGVAPLLGPLADNGGPTQTHSLLPGSPAIDAGSPDCPPPSTDQRGVARPQGSACDIGAFELEQVPTPTPTSTPTCTLTPTPTPTPTRTPTLTATPTPTLTPVPSPPGGGGGPVGGIFDVWVNPSGGQTESVIHSSDPNAGIVGGIAAAVALGAITVGGAAWYARRRLLG